MNAEETKQAAQVMIEVANGKKRQRRWSNNPKGGWMDCVPDEGWNWEAFEYRIKPEPLEGWVNVYPHKLFSSLHLDRELAELEASSDRLRCVKMREVEE